MAESEQPGATAPTTPDERSMAVLAHVLQLVGGWIAPLIIFFVKRQSRFVSFHALQVLLLEVVWVFLIMTVIGAIFLAMAVSVVVRGAYPHNSASPILFLVFATFWLALGATWVVKVVLAIVYGIKASRGEWAEYPFLGRLARNILHIGPDGAVVNE